jgi:SAM-dependent methyltransferase
MKRQFQFDFLTNKGLTKSHFLLDFGCGTLRGGMPLIEYLDIGHYYGVDVRPEVLEEANRELEEARLVQKKPTLMLSSDSAHLPKGKFDYVWAFSVLIHMDDNNLRRAMSLVKNCLMPQGFFFANVNIGNGPEQRWQGFPVVQRPLEFYKTVAAENAMTAADIGTLSFLGHNSGVESQDKQHMIQFSHLLE